MIGSHLILVPTLWIDWTKSKTFASLQISLGLGPCITTGARFLVVI
jgi:hypothetical protein